MSEPPPGVLPAIDAAVGALYASISFAPGGRPDLARLRALMLPGARFVHATPDGLDVFDIDTFVGRFERQMAAGVLRAVEEREIAARTELFGAIAQRFSTYRGRFEVEGRLLDARGINAIHLVREGDRWLVASLIWDDEREDRPIPAAYLG